jgi:HD-GYP domain-containing protein (c-di-GMP phosphodiesterase class II)
MFYIVTGLFIDIVQKNNESRLEIRTLTREIDADLRLLEYITINNAIDKFEKYETQSKVIYEALTHNLNNLQKSCFFEDNKESIQIINKLKNRIKGYKFITSSLREEVQADSEDGLYAILALTSTGQKISAELEELNNIITNISTKNLKETNDTISKIKFTAMFITFLFFLLVLYINKKVISSILYRIHSLKDEIVSFFDLLSHKRVDTIHINHEGKDEIAEIAKVIDEHMYIAEKIVIQEREESERIEAKVKEATKEIMQLNKEIEATQREIVFTMGAIAEERSRETGNHVKRVAEYSLILARLYGLSLEESLLLKNASPMHDIGKIGIPDAILNKPGKFTDEEFDIMKSHSEIGYRMLKHSNKSILKAASILAYEHHERWDGRGYPRGLKGEEIHIYGRITAIADVFDALGSDRVYKEAWPLQKIIKLFEEERGKQFDPELTDIFLDNLEHFLAAKEVIEQDSEDKTLSKFIEDFNRVDKYILID